MLKFGLTVAVLMTLIGIVGIAGIAGVAMADGGEESAYGDQPYPLIEQGSIRIYGPHGQLVVQGAAKAGSLVIADHLDTTRVLMTAGIPTGLGYGPYGTPSDADHARYAGHLYDVDQALYRTPNRHYDPFVARFLSVDPRRQSASPYLYADNNPVTNVDPSGGAYVPFFLRSGFATVSISERNVSRSAQLIQGLITDPNEYVIDQLVARPDDAFFHYSTEHPPGSRFLSLGRSYVSHQFYSGGPMPEHGDDVYWLVGMDTPVRRPVDVAETFARWRELRPGIASNIILIDLTGDAHRSQPIRSALDEANISHGTIRARVVDPTANVFEVDGRRYDRPGFGEFIRSFTRDFSSYRQSMEQLFAEHAPRRPVISDHNLSSLPRHQPPPVNTSRPTTHQSTDLEVPDVGPPPIDFEFSDDPW